MGRSWNQCFICGKQITRDNPGRVMYPVPMEMQGKVSRHAALFTQVKVHRGDCAAEYQRQVDGHKPPKL